MLFHSPAFVLGFLPLALGGFFLAGRVGRPRLGARAGWSPPACSFMAGGIRIRSACCLDRSWRTTASASRSFALARAGRPQAARRWLIAGIAANLALLGWFKYANFLVHVCCACTRRELDIFLPLAISFFTFQQIMFLVEQ